MPHTLEAIHKVIGGEFTGDGEQVITGVNALNEAGPGELTFAEHDRYAPQVASTQASAVIVSVQFPLVPGKNIFRVANPRGAFARAMAMFQLRPSIPNGIHSSAVVSDKATLAKGVSIAECAVIRDKARIGAETVVNSAAHIGSGVVIGDSCVIGPGVILMDGVQIGNRVTIHGGTVIGGDGFGYVWSENRHAKIPQVGSVIIEDDVEIGCNVCIDRATFGATIVRRGTKIDNLVQIGHNDSIGEDVIITGQVGFSGSVTVGNRSMFGGKAGVADHITIGSDARIGAATAVTKDVRSGEMVWGFPGRPIRRVKRELASLVQLPKLIKQFKELLLRMQDMESRIERIEKHRSKE